MIPHTLSAKPIDAQQVIQQQAELIAEQKATIAQQAAAIHSLEERVVELERQVEEARRAGKRQATPFSKGAPKKRPKKPGQKAGHRAAHRPAPERVDREEEAPLPTTCPECGGAVIEEEVKVQYQVDIPRPIPTVVTQFNVHIGQCEKCRRRFQGRHPEQTSDALGAAGVQVGPHAIGLAAEMKHELGVSYGKAARLLDTAFGLTVNRSTLVRADLRLADKLEPTYHRLVLRLRGSEVIHVDETGWKIGGRNAIAEREIRPSVIIRKTNGCNRSQAGARTHSIITSVIRTCRKHGRDFIHTIKAVLHHTEPIALDVASDSQEAPARPSTPALARASP